MIFGGIYSSMRQAIKGPAVVDGKKLYIYPEQYEGQECNPLIFCTGPVPAQQVEPLIPWLMQQTGAKSFYLPSADFDENFLNLVPAAHVEGLYSWLDYYQNVDDPFSTELINRYDILYPGDAKFTAGSACSGMFRGLRLWAAAVEEAGSLDQEDVVKALDHAKIDHGPGGPAEMVPGQHHVRMNMYIAQARNGRFEVVENLGIIDPKECIQGLK